MDGLLLETEGVIKDMVASAKRLDCMIQALNSAEHALDDAVDLHPKEDVVLPAVAPTDDAAAFFEAMDAALQQHADGLRFPVAPLSAPSATTDAVSDKVVYRINDTPLPKTSTTLFLEKVSALLHAVDCTLSPTTVTILVSRLVALGHDLEAYCALGGATCFPTSLPGIVWRTGLLIARVRAEVSLANHVWGFRLRVSVEGILRARIGAAQGPAIPVYLECDLVNPQQPDAGLHNLFVTLPYAKPAPPQVQTTASSLRSVIANQRATPDTVTVTWQPDVADASSRVQLLFDATPLLRARIVESACSHVHALFRSDVGLLYSMGKGVDGALGHGSFADLHHPAPIESFFEQPEAMVLVARIAAASDPAAAHAAHSLAVTTTGAVYSWGARTASGTLSKQGHRSDLPTRIASLDVACTRVAAGAGFSLALTETGQVFSWGKWLHGRLGLGPTPPALGRKTLANKPIFQQYQLSPCRVTDLADVVVTEIACGQAHAMAIASNGQLYAWGRNVHGQLGLGHCHDQCVPQSVAISTETSSLGGATLGVTAIACGDMLSIAVDGHGHVWTWGAGTCGHRLPSLVMENGLRSDLVAWPWLYPQQTLQLPPTIVDVAAGDRHYHARTHTGDVYTWQFASAVPKLEAKWGTIEAIACGGSGSVLLSGLSFVAQDMARLWLQCKTMDDAGDVVLLVSGRRIAAHQLVLATRCEVLRARLVDERQAREATNHRMELVLYDLRHDVCLLVLEYLYTDALLTRLDPASSLPRDLLAAARILQLPHLASLCQPYVVEMAPCIAVSSYATDFVGALGSFVWSDVVLVADGERIYAHKCILAARSDYFRGLLTSSLRDANLAELSVDMRFPTLRRVLEFVYSGIVPPDASDDVILDDLVAADRLGIARLKALSEARLVVTLENCIDVLVTADMVTAPVLREAAVIFVLENLRVLAGAPSFLQLVQDYPALMDEIIHHPSRTTERWAWREYEGLVTRESAEKGSEWSDDAEFPLLPLVFWRPWRSRCATFEDCATVRTRESKMRATSKALISRTRKAMVAPGDVVAQQQKILEEVEIFAAVKSNNISRALAQLRACPDDYHRRDTVGATPLHIAFLYQHVELGQTLVLADLPRATAVYEGSSVNDPSPYQGENILHIAIVQRNLALIKWLATTVPDLLDAETTGDFFAPSKPCYFGGTPLLFALASRQLVAATCILEVAHAQPQDSKAHKTTIFMADSYGNNALHLAVVHNAPDVFDFAIARAIRRLWPPDDAHLPSLAAFLKTAQGDIADVFVRFLRRPNHEGLTPLALAAALGRREMFEHMLRATTTIAWVYGPVTAKMLPLQELEEKCYTQSRIKTALECLCSSADLTACMPPHLRHKILHARLNMLGIYEVKTLLDKKWKFVGCPMFFGRVRATVTAAMAQNGAQTVCHIILELGVVLVALYEFAIEIRRLAGGIQDYLNETGAAKLDNILCLTFGIAITCAVVCRVAGAFEIEDLFVGFACLNQFLYMFFFMMGFRCTGPFVVMLLRMLTQDFFRFAAVYVWILLGVSMNLYVILDDRNGFAHLVTRTKSLLLAAFCNTFDYAVYEASDLSFVAQCLIVTYLVVVVIVLLNLLIAMMGNTYDNILKASEQRWYAERVNIMCSMEQTLNARQPAPVRPRRQSLVQMLAELKQPKHAMDTSDGERFLQVELVCNDKWLEDDPTPASVLADPSQVKLPPILDNDGDDEPHRTMTAPTEAEDQSVTVAKMLDALEVSVNELVQEPAKRAQLAPLTPRRQAQIDHIQGALADLRTMLQTKPDANT
ncbi:hypothetical protein SPRG_06392 [Saprolegnia parasitica CBS 223.65]|uniref:BTB domain-containing protein n=1 Tax=Saprolegnia parasitica (strain CBS 223.65) TaxID=695850 RepID=A0A067CCN9_SAPPC|nr:hypothetical protein SPRG_06392 [Saprolegnia parasitica CBS 223.65]KDO28534.1 hypothetical protein SPRG_06392 [Saprolegnia parasitica CBS 223.65]|eukprot:XP_012200600.1 hypothetical protein SPRG_06392 [Saprolegnia parasitica CBS 223.65]